MKVLLEPGSYRSLNMGDVAMLQVAVRRIRSVWPEAEMHAFTTDARRLASYCPGLQPLDPDDRKRQLMPGRLEWKLRRTAPPSCLAWWDRIRRRRCRRPEGSVLARLLPDCDLMVVVGMGGLTDAFVRHAWSILELVGVARQAGIGTLLFGQGLGPITAGSLWAQARGVLPRVDFLALREKRAGLPLARALGIPEERVAVTGDDAVELAYDRQADSLGGAIGVSLRLSGYAGTDTGLLGPVREELRKAAQEHAAALLPLPISLHEDDSDLRSAAELLGDITHGDALDSPEAVIRQAGRCRVVVTGSYHGAVFSLSQGVPVVALANSQYYEDKFYGLADMFGVGCELVSPRGSAFARSLASALTRCWDQAPHVRESLLEAARRQIAAGQAAYRKALQGAGGRGGSPHRSRPGG